MLNNIKLATKDTFIYSLGNISTKIVGLILLPLYTDELTVYEYGILGTVEISIQVLLATFTIKLEAAFGRWYWDKKYKNKQQSLFFTTLISLIILASFMIILFIPFSNTFSLYLLDDSKYSYLFVLLLFSAALQIISKIVFLLMRLQRKPLLFSISNIIKLVITLFLTILFITTLNRGIEGIIEAQIIGFLGLILLSTKYIKKNIKIEFEYPILKEMIRFSYPLAISSVGSILLTVTDRYVIRYIGKMEDMGIYHLGFKLASVLKIFFINSVISALGPLKYKMMDEPDNKRFYSKIMTYTAFGFIFLLFVFSFFSLEAVRLLAQNPEYWSAYQIVPILCFSQLFELFRSNAQFGLSLVKKTSIISGIILLTSFLGIVLNILFVIHIGTIGAAIAVLITQILFFLFIYHYAQKYYPIPYEMKKILIMTIIAAIFVGITYFFINPMSLIARLILKALLILIFPVVLYFFNFYEPIELKRLQGAWHKWKNIKNWKNIISNIKFK